MPDAWRAILARRVPGWDRIDATQRARLEAVALDLLARPHWEAARDFTLTEEVQVTIAGLAALLAVGLPGEPYRQVRTILVRGEALVRAGTWSVVPGLVSDEPMSVIGEVVHRGPIMIAWDAVDAESRHPGRGRNVVFHEFAHALDLADGTVDGTPPLADRVELARWVEVCTDAYHAVAAGHGGCSLDPYASVNVGEFFAVATEAFFDVPALLRQEHPNLYDVLRAYYRQDPAASPTPHGSQGDAKGPGGGSPGR